MLVVELTHVESDVGSLVSEEQFGNGLGQLRLSGSRRTGQEHHAARLSAQFGALRSREARDRTLDYVQRLNDSLVLPLNPLADEFLGASDFIAVQALPRVFGDAELVASDCLADLLKTELLPPAKLDDGNDVGEVESFSLLVEDLVKLLALFRRRFLEAGEAGGELGDQRAADDVIGFGDGDCP